jgi:hypothetical protein
MTMPCFSPRVGVSSVSKASLMRNQARTWLPLSGAQGLDWLRRIGADQLDRLEGRCRRARRRG